jgi:hypothetical protein
MKRARTQEKWKATLAAKATKKGIVAEIGKELDIGDDSEEEETQALSRKRKRPTKS